jgi:hypothetical protein
VYRVQPPFEEETISHGLCDDCFRAEMERINKELAAPHGVERMGSFCLHQIAYFYELIWGFFNLPLKKNAKRKKL